MVFRLFSVLVVFSTLAGALTTIVVSGRQPFGPAVLVTFAASLVPAYFVARAFVRPFREIRSGADRIAGGDYEARVPSGGWQESQALAFSLNEMSARLAGQIARLQAERQQLRAILGGMIEGVIAIGPGQRVLFANDAASRMLEFDVNAAIDRPIWELTRQPGLQVILEKATKTGTPQREDLELKRPSALFLTVYVAPLTANEGAGAVMVLHDTSDIRRLERLRQDFVANVSHELKTPLAVVKACVEALLDGAGEDPEARQMFLQQISDQGERLDSLIHDLLSLARIESGVEVMEFAALPVAEMVSACVDRHRPRAEAKNMTIHIEPSDPKADVWADEEALRQMLDNLVDNAVKYTQSGGEIRIGWSIVHSSVSIAVSDNGPGIPERDQPRIFERFYRVDRARSRELGGTGLGLSIVKHLAQVLRGTVKLSSQVGKGTTFCITLPRTA